MTPEELATRLTDKVEYMISQYLPRPDCPIKNQAHKELVQQVKDMIAGRLSGNNGLNIEIKV